MEERPIESVLRGDFDTFKTHLYAVAGQSWPDMSIYIYDSTKAAYQKSDRVEGVDVDGERVLINWPPGDSSWRDRDERTQVLAQDIGRTLDVPSSYDANAMALRLTILDMNVRGLGGESDKTAAAMLAPLPPAVGVASRFNLLADDPTAAPGQKMEIGTLGVDSSICSHCQATSAAITPHTCDPTDPHQVRLQQLTRLFTGYHELGHLGDFHSGAVSQLLEKKSSITPDVKQNAYESIADSYASLMMIKDLGEEGAAYARLWATVRSNSLGHADHRTVATLKSTLDWADANPDQLAAMSPSDLFMKAKELTVTISRHDLEQFEAYRKDLFDPHAAQVEEDISRADVLRNPRQIAARLQQIEESQIFPSDGRHASSVGIAEQERLSLWAESGRAQALSDLQRLNPLATPEWEEQEKARSAQCRVNLDATKLEIARDTLERMKSWEEITAEPDADAAEQDQNQNTTQLAGQRPDLLMPRSKSP